MAKIKLKNAIIISTIIFLILAISTTVLAFYYQGTFVGEMAKEYGGAFGVGLIGIIIGILFGVKLR